MIAAAVFSGLAVAVVTGSLLTPRPRELPVRPTPVSDPPPRRKRKVPDAVWSFAAVALVLLVAGPLLAAVIALLIVGTPRLRRILAQRAERSSIERDLPDAIQMLVLVAHAGLTPHQAIGFLTTRAPISTQPAFAEVLRRTQRGSALADALAALPDMLGAGAAGIADTLALAERNGSPIGSTLEQLSFDVRERRRRRAEADARALPVRMSFPLVICTLPSFVLTAVVPAVLAALASLDVSGL